MNAQHRRYLTGGVALTERDFRRDLCWALTDQQGDFAPYHVGVTKELAVIGGSEMLAMEKEEVGNLALNEMKGWHCRADLNRIMRRSRLAQPPKNSPLDC